MRTSMKNLASATALTFLTSTVSLPVSAAMVGNTAALSSPEQSIQQIDRDGLKAYFDRQEVIEAMSEHGVTPEMAKRRVDSMTDQEAQRLAKHIESEPAGAGVVGALFTVFIVLLVTDILGLTKVFPFTRPVR